MRFATSWSKELDLMESGFPILERRRPKLNGCDPYDYFYLGDYHQKNCSI